MFSKGFSVDKLCLSCYLLFHIDDTFTEGIRQLISHGISVRRRIVGVEFIQVLLIVIEAISKIIPQHTGQFQPVDKFVLGVESQLPDTDFVRIIPRNIIIENGEVR